MLRSVQVHEQAQFCLNLEVSEVAQGVPSSKVGGVGEEAG